MRASGTPGLGGGPRSSSRWTWPSRAVGGQGGTEGLPPEPASATSASQAVFRSPRESAATAARREPLGPAAPSPQPSSPRPRASASSSGKKKKESLFPKRCVLPSASFPGTLAGSAGWRLLLLPGGPQGKAAFPERPAHLPGRRRYLQGCNLRCNFPASLRPAPRDAARARAPARRSAAPEPRGAARGRRAAPSRAPAAARRSLASPPGLREGRLAASSRVLGDRETGLINVCLRLPGPAPTARRPASAQTGTRKTHAAGPWISGVLGAAGGGVAKTGLSRSWSPASF